MGVSRKQCEKMHRMMIREVLGVLEEVAERYDMSPSDFNMVRAKVKSWNWKIYNTWLAYFAEVFDKKYRNKINIDGENEETHLNG